MLRHFLRRLLRRPGRRRAPLPARPWCEQLESRTLLSASTVLAQSILSNLSSNLGSLLGLHANFASAVNASGGKDPGAGAGSKGVFVGVLDEGIQITHPGLRANVWTNATDPADGRDNDGNGYADDTNGWDFVGNNRTVYDGGSRGTQDAHGTHVAGIISALDNAVGLIAAKFLGRRGGTATAAALAVDYLTDLKVRQGVNVVAVNASFAGAGYSQPLHDAIARAADANILFVAAAGNSGANLDATPVFPAGYTDLPNVISVAAIDNGGGLASWSNYGSSVDLAAPGVSILSTVPTDGYAALSGTSMATPFVTGAAALYAAANPGATAAQIKAALLGSVTPTASLQGKTRTGGRLNVGALMAADNRLPAASDDGADTSETGTSAADAPADAPSDSDAETVQGISENDEDENDGVAVVGFIAPAVLTPVTVTASRPVFVTSRAPARGPAPVPVVPASRELPILQRVVGGVGEQTAGVDEEPQRDDERIAPGQRQAPAPERLPAPAARRTEEDLLRLSALDTVFAGDDLQSVTHGQNWEAPAVAPGAVREAVAPLSATAGLVLALGGYWANPVSAFDRERRPRAWKVRV